VDRLLVSSLSSASRASSDFFLLFALEGGGGTFEDDPRATTGGGGMGIVPEKGAISRDPVEATTSKDMGDAAKARGPTAVEPDAGVVDGTGRAAGAGGPIGCESTINHGGRGSCACVEAVVPTIMGAGAEEGNCSLSVRTGPLTPTCTAPVKE